MDILLTNDDGIDSAGIAAMREKLAGVGDVTVVAPADDQSRVGRSVSQEVSIREHEWGYAIGGTPSDCVVAGLQALDLDPDLVISGCNRGANLGGYVLGRSGTVGAAVESAFFNVPAIAASLYVPSTTEDFENVRPAQEAYAPAVEATAYLVNHALDVGVFEHADYLNLNAPPMEEAPTKMVVTRPSQAYAMDANHNGNSVTLHDRIWDMMAAGTIDDPPGTDRQAVVAGKISVSPLTAPHTTEHHESLDALASTYADRASETHDTQ